MPEEKKSGGKAAAKAAKEAAALAERQAAAENAFAAADADGSGNVDGAELEGLLLTMLRREGIEFDRSVVSEFVRDEFALADTDGSGDVDFDEFIAYYNSLIDRIKGGAMNEALEKAKHATAKKLEEEAIAQDGGVFSALYGVLAILLSPSVRDYTGLTVPFVAKDLRGSNPESTPNPEHGSSSHGIILDLSRRAQRLLTPWGSLPIGYRLSFNGYQEKVAPAEEEPESAKRRPKKGPVAWPLIPAGPAEDETYPLFFSLCRPPRKQLPDEPHPPKPPLIRLRRVPKTCHFQVIELFGQPLPAGQANLVSEAAALKKLTERWNAQLKKNIKDPKVVDLPAEDCEGGPVVNLLAGSCVAVAPHKLESLKKRKEVTGRAANKRFAEEDLHRALKVCNNADAGAARKVVNMASSENNVLDRRGGHSTRAQVRYALQTVDYDVDLAEWMLKNQEKLLKQKVDFISEKLGLESGLGYPSRQTLERMLVVTQCNEGAVMAELKKKWKLDIELMSEIVWAAEVEELLTPERCDAFAFSRPFTADEAKHVEELYLSDEFKKSKDAVLNFLTQAGTVLKRSLGSASREEVELLLRDMGCEAERVLTFLGAWSNMCDIGPKQGQATREDCKRYLVLCDREEEQATTLMKTIWKLANPKAPKPPPKGSKKPPQPHYSDMCGYPSRGECEWALLCTRAEDKEGKPLAIEKAAELLTRLDTIHKEISAGEKHLGCKRDDVLWALDKKRAEAFIRVRGRGAGDPATVMLDAISHLKKRSSETGLRTAREEILSSLEKLSYDQSAAEKYLNGVGTLMAQESELGIVCREEVEEAMEANGLDDAKVIELFHYASELQKRRLDLGNPTRDEIKAMVNLAWELDTSERLEVAGKCLKIYRELMGDDTTLMSLFGQTPGAEEIDYLRNSALRFKGDHEQTMNYLKKVADIVGKGESLGNPTRELVVKTLEDFNLDQRKATQSIREDYHKRRDLQLKEEYKRKKEEAEAKAKADAAAA
jgi:hypothetical protein